MKKLDSNEILVIANAIIGGLLIGKALSILLGYKVLNESSQIAVLILTGLMFLQNGLSKLDNKENE